MWLLRDLCGSYRVYVAVTGSMWFLQGLCGCYGVYVVLTAEMPTFKNQKQYSEREKTVF